MLLVCIGPDTFRAQEKARELETVFKQKYDQSGSSVERLASGKEGIDQIIERANTASLFSSRRFLRTANILMECPKAKQQVLIQALAKDPENVIVVSVEDEMSSVAAWKVFENIPKIIKYEFPLQQGAAFEKWAQILAHSFGIKDVDSIRRIAEVADGDSWFVWNEFLKLAAGGTSEVVSPSPAPGVYEYADAFIHQRPAWRSALLDEDVVGQLLNVFVSQARAAIRVRDGSTAGLHPYVVKKMKQRKIGNLEERLAYALMALLAQRAGLGDEAEAMSLL